MRHADTCGLHRVMPYVGYVPGGIHVSMVESPPRRSVPRPYEGPVGLSGLQVRGSLQYTTPLSQASSEFVTITHPHHPLRGQRVKVVRIRHSVDPDLIVQFSDGTHAALAMSSTDYAGTPAAAPPGEATPLLALEGL